MSWINDEIQDIDRLKQARAKGEELMLLREDMRREQCQMRWAQLQREIISLAVCFNQEAGRPLLAVLEGPSMESCIKREDGCEVRIEFCQQLLSVDVKYPSFSAHNRHYALRTMPISGVETVVWVD
jgi:hypothetical protein